MNDVLPRRAHLITLEGGEGAGKSTALATVRDCLQAAGCTLVVSREPGGTPLAEQLRAMVLHSSRQKRAGHSAINRCVACPAKARMATATARSPMPASPACSSETTSARRSTPRRKADRALAAAGERGAGAAIM